MRLLEQPISTNSVPRAFFPRVAIGCRLSHLSLKIYRRNLPPRWRMEESLSVATWDDSAWIGGTASSIEYISLWPYLSALEVRSRRGAIQIHVYLYLYLFTYLLDHWLRSAVDDATIIEHFKWSGQAYCLTNWLMGNITVRCKYHIL